jgi:glycerophosphoryl diester phosphodiesterase
VTDPGDPAQGLGPGGPDSKGNAAFSEAGPPWILGHRGSPWEAPENTIASLKCALAWGLDGVEYDLRACAGGKAMLMHDARLERTTDATGPLAERTPVDLHGVDAGIWFDRSFRGEPVPALEDALALLGGASDTALRPALHMIELKETGLADAVARHLAERGPRLSVRVASFSRAACLEAKDAGLPTMLLAERARADDLAWVEKNGLDAYGVGPGGWRTEDGAGVWPCERWAWGVDEPEDLLEACRIPLAGFNTNEPARALAVRALARRVGPDVPYPIEVGPLVIEPIARQGPGGSGTGAGGGGDGTTSSGAGAGEAGLAGPGPWRGVWLPTARVTNPFAYPVRAAAGLFLRHGAFDVEGLPVRFDLTPGETIDVPFRLSGGSASPGGDPLFAVRYTWERGPGRAAGSILLDAPLHRVRCVRADESARRLVLLEERPGDRPASITLRRQGRELLLALENEGGLEAPHLIATLEGHLVRAGRGLRLRLPEDFDQRARGLAFNCGIEGRLDGQPQLRRWAGGLPEGLRSGVPGRLLPRG